MEPNDSVHGAHLYCLVGVCVTAAGRAGAGDCQSRQDAEGSHHR